jgi:hypothetical protein
MKRMSILIAVVPGVEGSASQCMVARQIVIGVVVKHAVGRIK